MWGYAIFCEFPGCQRFEAVSVEGDVPTGWLSVAAGVHEVADEPESVGTYCGWAHMLQGLLQLAPEDTELALDIRHREPERHQVSVHRSGRPIADVPLPDEAGHA